MMAFNVLCCNTDAHAKNYAIMIYGDTVKLAPIYDVMCAEPWQGVTPYLAFAVASQRKWRDVEGRHWARQAKACGLSERFGLQSVLQVAERMLANLDEAAALVNAMPAGPHPMVEEFVGAIRGCCKHVISTSKR